MTKNHLPQPHRLLFVDALRGFAAIYVILFHIVNVPQPNLRISDRIYPMLFNGTSGVTLFFIISAFTLCYTLYGTQPDAKSTITFYIRRIFRIIPLYYIWLIVIITYNWGLHLYMLVTPDLYLYAGFGYNLFPGKQWGIVPASWTLSIEVIFYVFFPVLFKWVTNLKKAVAFLLLTLLISYVHYVIMSRLMIYKYIIEMGILSHLPTFAAGIVIFYVHKTLGEKKQRKKSFLIFSIAIALFLTIPYVFEYIKAGYFTRIYTMTFIYAILFIGLSVCPVSFFTNRVIIFLGTLSYSLYLNHPPVIWLLLPVYKHIYSLGLHISLSWFICTLLTLAPLIGVSYVTHRFIEKPGLAIGRNLIKKIANRKENKRQVLAPARHFDSSVGQAAKL